MEAQAVKLNAQCPICGKKFHLKPSKLKIDKNHYCSRECHRVAKKSYMSGKNNHQYGLKGKLNASWKTGKKKTSYGYITVKSYGHPFARDQDYVFEHRLIAEKYLLDESNSVVIDGKRYLSPNYVVHHKNGVKDDNRVENLEVMLESDHQKMHCMEQNKTRRRDKYGRFVSESRK